MGDTRKSFDHTAHSFFSAECFNHAWELIEKTGRTPEEDEQMIATSFASLWHWMQRADCKPSNLSIAYWQLARIYTVVGRLHEARRYAQLSKDHCPEGDAFLLAYAHEALARVDALSGATEAMNRHLQHAKQLSELVTVAEDKQQILDDLKTISPAKPV